MSLAPLPVTVIAGYLGAGKTTLVNHLLRNPGGRRIMVMVNDFGDIDIDADLLESADEDTMTLSNGCICCTMGAELLYALSDALDRRPRPDHLVIEASGVAEPAKIAAAAHAEPEMLYSGVVTLADAANLPALLEDRLIGAQVAEQIRSADLVLVTKADIADPAPAREGAKALTKAPVLTVDGPPETELVLGPANVSPPRPGRHADHGAAYESWAATGGVATLAGLKAALTAPPPGLFRFKGRVALADGGAAEAHLVGRTWAVTRADEAAETKVVGIGPAGAFDRDAVEAWWRGALAPGAPED